MSEIYLTGMIAKDNPGFGSELTTAMARAVAFVARTEPGTEPGRIAESHLRVLPIHLEVFDAVSLAIRAGASVDPERERQAWEHLASTIGLARYSAALDGLEPDQESQIQAEFLGGADPTRLIADCG